MAEKLDYQKHVEEQGIDNPEIYCLARKYTGNRPALYE